MTRVDGSRTGGIVRFGCVRVYLGEVARELASALLVSRVRPAMGGRARVSAVRVLGMGRL